MSDPLSIGVDTVGMMAATLFAARPEEFLDFHDRIMYGKLARTAWTLASAVESKGNGVGYAWQAGPWDEGEA
jgi:hypothetical protein